MKGCFRGVAILTLLSVALTACAGGDEASLRAESRQLSQRVISLEEAISSVKQENTKLKEELEALKNEAKVLLAKAKSSAESEDYDNALSLLSELLSTHPASPEAETAKSLASDYQEAKKRIADALAVEAEKQKAEEARLAAEKERRLQEATSAMRKSYDEVHGVSFYIDKTSSEFSNTKEFSLYIVVPDDTRKKPYLRMQVKWTGEKWLFIDEYTFKADDKVINYSVSYSDVKRDNSHGVVWEYIDVVVNNRESAVIHGVLEAEKTIIRHSGDMYHEDRVISNKEKEALQRVLDAFEALGGVLEKPF